MKVYIAGPMTGHKDLNKPAFIEASLSLMDMGYVVLNPATLPEGLTQSEYMDICFAMVRASDAIYLLEGYENSKGALAELAYAEKLEMEVMKQ